jgi:small-conductance mechanosensitive channel
MKHWLPLALIVLVAAVLLSAGARGRAALALSKPLVTPTAEPEEGEAGSEEVGVAEEEATDEVIMTRTPAPTLTPGVITEKVQELTYRAGLARTTFLGISVSDWINLAISLALVLLTYLLATFVIRRWLPPAVERTKSEFDNRALESVGPYLRWLLVLVGIHFATVRLTFLSVETKELLGDIYFSTGVVIGALAALKIVDLAADFYRQEVAREADLDRLNPVVTLLRRVAIIIVVVTGVTIFLSHFGINVSGLVAALGIAGLAFSLAAQDTLADAINGFIILVDQPFRVGDRIQIQGLDTWGDVVDIGTRTTRIRTRDNRMVVVPNSIIGKNQVVNYSYPDPEYRIETHIGIAYGTDIEHARQVLLDAVRHVEGVLPHRPVDALYIEMGDSAMVFRVRWWIESYVDTRRIYDRVHTALQQALDEAGVESPFPIQTQRLEFGPVIVEQSPGGTERSGQTENPPADQGSRRQ